jgi:hypothetical protein
MLKKMEMHYREFLNESSGFYQTLLDQLCAKYELMVVALLLHNEVDSENIGAGRSNNAQLNELQQQVLLSCHRIFVYLGDLGGV